MKVYKIKVNDVGPCVLDKLEEVLEDLRVNLDEGCPGDSFKIEITDMTEEEFEELPEFEGY